MKTKHTNSFYKTAGRTALCLFACTVMQQATAQVDLRIKQAEQYYAAGDFLTAANLYEQYLKPSAKEKPKADFPLNAKHGRQGSSMGKGVTKNDLLYKQAESYRLAHYLPQAAERYKAVAAADMANYAHALYWYAVCQRALGNTTAAEESLNEFLAKATANDPYRAAAENELATLKFVKQQTVRPDTVMYTFNKFTLSAGAEKGAFAPLHIGGDQFIITGTEKDTVAQAGVNPNHNRLYAVSLANNVLHVSEPVALGADAYTNQGAATISADGKHLYFTQWKTENGKQVFAVYHATKTAEGWSAAAEVSTVNKGGSSKHPQLSADGQYLFFSSNREGGKGGYDIWYASVNADGSVGEAVHTGAAINTAHDEQTPFYHSATKTLVFATDGKAGMGGFDLFTAKGEGNNWSTIENMGYPVNSVRDDVYFFTSDKQNLLKNAVFSSDRGSECCLETYTVTKAPKKKIFTGKVVDKKDNQPVANAIVLINANGKQLKVTTDANGRYTTEIETDADGTVTVSKHRYAEKQSGINIINTDESDWSSTKFTNNDIVLDRKIILTPETVVTVYFDFDKHNIKPDAAFKLDSLYDILVKNPGAIVQISGYTDGLGSEEYNKILSDKRAKACADYLMAKGVDSARISFESFGACCPVEMELINGRDNADGRAKNRRGLINISYPPKEEE
ncbi:flagellar motor protein MotB [Lacibacter luteus]|uniref:Flagellar motor protein MotB n=1 Tax=Lacibacter luteus TaxID=2508719 RepID=A0A4Q1CKC6_9BACT|nr:OmpA family protein [Lacibacter luteus]RXK60857.1 flagellar motor protein MotB [Lacibacter luteus]